MYHCDMHIISELKTIKAQETQKETLISSILQLYKKNLDGGMAPGRELSP